MGHFLYSVILFATIFTGMLIIFGTAQTNFSQFVATPLNCLNGVSPPICNWPQYLPPKVSNVTYAQTTTVNFPACLLWIPSCFNGAVGTIANTGQAIWNGMAILGYDFAYFGGLILTLVYKIQAVIFLISGINNLLNADFGIPFVTYIFTGFILISIVEMIRVLWPGGGD